MLGAPSIVPCGGPGALATPVSFSYYLPRKIFNTIEHVKGDFNDAGQLSM